MRILINVKGIRRIEQVCSMHAWCDVNLGGQLELLDNDIPVTYSVYGISPRQQDEIIKNLLVNGYADLSQHDVVITECDTL